MPKIHYLFFAILLLALGMIFEYHKTTGYKPQSTHAWRQSDCVSFTTNYHKYNNSLLKPRLYNRQEADGYMVGEFTGLYFLSAQLYKVFGVHDEIPRGLNMLIFFLGLFALFRMTFEITASIFWSYFLPTFFFSAPVLTYYGNNFLPDAPAFGFLLMGWAVFMNYYKQGNVKMLYGAAILWSIAGLLKVTMLLSVVAIGILFLIEWLGWATFKKEEKIFKQPFHAVGAFSLTVGIVAVWYAFSIYYNQVNETDYFLNGTLSPWTIDKIDWFTYTLYRTFFFWSKYYFMPLNHLLIVFLTLFILFAKRYPGHFLYGMTFFTFLGFIVYYNLWFYQFKDHDYYIIAGYIHIVFLLLAAIMILKKHFPKLYHTLSFRVVLVLFLVLNIAYSKMTIKDRYEGTLQWTFNEHLYDDNFKEYLDKLGISRNDLVISIPDFSPNTTLYLMDRPGFTEWIDKKGTLMSADHTREFIRRGAEYMIVHDSKWLNRPHVAPFKGQEIGDYKGIKVYNLRLPEE